MGVLADWQIKKEVCIEPFAEAEKRPGVISYGVTSYGYDIRLGDEYRIFTNARCATVDPKSFALESFVTHKGLYCDIPPNSYALAESLEYVEIPRDVLGICVGKSTYARCGIIVNVTPLEPEWKGKITIEISNATPLPARVYSFEGIMQVVFYRADNERLCDISYKDKTGKYQDQLGLTLAKVL